MGIRNKINDGYLYYLTITVVDWVDVFTRPVYKYIILDSLKYCQKEKGLEVYAWCLMSNHLHMIAGAKDGYNLSDILRDFKKFTSKQIVDSIKEENESRRDWMMYRFELAGKYNNKIKNFKFWQDGNEPKEIHTNDFLDQKLDYIHRNPIEAGLVFEEEHYMFSSAIDYSGGKGLLEVKLID